MPPALGEAGLYPGDPSEQPEVLLPEEPRLRLKGGQPESQEKAWGGCMEEAISGEERLRP